MASEPKKLLQIPEHVDPAENAYIWVVLNGVDYRTSLAAILNKVTRVKLGLDRVDNTSDEEKPISTAVAAALGQKANASEVVSLATFNALANSLVNYVTKPELDAILLALHQEIDDKLSDVELTQVLNTTLAPIDTALTNILGRLENAENGYISAYVRTNYFETTIADLRTSLTSEYTTAILEGIEPLSLAIDSFSAELQTLRDEFDAFKIVTNQRLYALEQATNIGEGIISVGPNDW